MSSALFILYLAMAWQQRVYQRRCHFSRRRFTKPRQDTTLYRQSQSTVVATFRTFPPSIRRHPIYGDVDDVAMSFTFFTTVTAVGLFLLVLLLFRKSHT